MPLPVQAPCAGLGRENADPELHPERFGQGDPNELFGDRSQAVAGPFCQALAPSTGPAREIASPG
eukprot:6645161-Heterocapsa_arctica.AAC.1